MAEIKLISTHQNGLVTHDGVIQRTVGLENTTTIKMKQSSVKGPEGSEVQPMKNQPAATRKCSRR